MVAQLKNHSQRKPFISVVIPAYNTEGTIQESIDSVLNQTYKNFEVIVIDDGSPDSVADLVKEKYGAKVKLIQQSNKGLAGARNTGIRAARGEFVAFLDSDDAWLPVKLDEQVDQIIAHPEGAVFYSDCYFYEGGEITGRWTNIHKQENGKILSKLIERSVMIPILTAIVRKENLEAVGCFDEVLRQVEDYDLWLRLAAKGAVFFSNQLPLALYRINPAGLSQDRLKMAKTQLGVYKKVLSTSNTQEQKLIKKQINIFELEVLHQNRLLAIKSKHNLKAAILTLRMARYAPLRMLNYSIAALLILWGPDKLRKRLR